MITDNIIYSDEVIFSLEDNRIKVWRKWDDIYEMKEKSYSNRQIHIWAGISRKGKT